MATVMGERLYTLAEVASRFQVHEQTVRRWVREGQIKAYRAGHQLRFNEGDLAAFISPNVVAESEADHAVA